MPTVRCNGAELYYEDRGSSQPIVSGQVCTSAERFYVHEAVHDEFVDGLVEMARALRVGNGLEGNEIGPLVTEAAREKVERLVDDAVDRGATVVCGGRVPSECETGWFYEPTVLTDVTPEMAIVREETFGPVAPIVEVDSFEEALEGDIPETVAGQAVEETVTIDGFKLLLEDGSWLLVRPSGTEPKLRIYAKTTDADRLTRLLDAGQGLLESLVDSEPSA